MDSLPADGVSTGGMEGLRIRPASLWGSGDSDEDSDDREEGDGTAHKMQAFYDFVNAHQRERLR